MTDGEENKNPTINSVLPVIIQAGVRVVSVNFGLDLFGLNLIEITGSR